MPPPEISMLACKDLHTVGTLYKEMVAEYLSTTSSNIAYMPAVR